MVTLDGEQFLTVDEAAARLGVKPATVYAYVSRGILKSYRRGIKRQRLYRRAEVEALLRLTASTEEPRAAPATVSWPRGRRRTIREIPLAESWIRD
jgi:excisionase family DNA binding protein